MIARKGLRSIAFALAVAVALALSVLKSVPTYAQVAGATLSGTVTDPSGAGIPGAQVSIKNSATGITNNLTADPAGYYSAPNLLPGTYDLTVSAKGFATQVQSGITLAVGAQQTLNVTMQVGQTTEKIQVTATAAAVQLSSSTLTGDVTPTTVRELPLNGRDWTQLATLQAGIVSVRTQATAGSATSPRGNRGYGNQLSDSGHRPFENNYRINGISVVDYANGAPGSVIGVTLGVDAIQEFSVMTSNYPADYGRTAGGVINAVTKSGTNNFHGDAYWFIREKSLDARNFFDKNIPPFHRNQFGASGGGPIKKDKTFIFADYEGIRQDKSLSFSDKVPSAAARNGNLCSLCPAGQQVNITVNPLVAPFLGFYPLPNAGLTASGDTGTWLGAGLAHFTENYVSIRGDHHFSEKDSLAASWFWDKAPFTQPDPMVNVIHESLTLRTMASLEETHVFSPSLVNTARIGFNRANGFVNIPVSAINPLAADKSGTFSAIPGHASPILQVPGLTQMQGSLGAPSRNRHIWNSFQAYDDAFLTKGTHSMKFGFAFENMEYNLQTFTRSNGFFNFPSLEGFLLNEPKSVSLLDPAISQEAGNRQKLFGAYLQDDWRARSNLTLNLGVRYEPVTNPTESHDRFQLINDFYAGSAVPVGKLFATNPSLRNFEPRVGFSWDPFHNGKTAIRGGFGIFDVLPIDWVWGFAMGSSYPFAFNVTKGGLPAGSFPGGVLQLIGFSLSNAQQRYIEPDPKRNYAMNWNFNIQREITPSLTATIGYVGSHTVHQAQTPDNMDMVLPTHTSAGWLWPCDQTVSGFPATPCTGLGTFFNPNVGDLRATMWFGTSLYQGLHAQVTKKMSHGFQVQGSYTWGKCLDNGSGAQIGDPFQNSIASPFWLDEHLRRGLCDFNVAHNFVLNYLWDIPGPKANRLASAVLSNWEVGGIFTAATGTPFTPLIGGDPFGMLGDPWPFPDRLQGAGCGNPVNSGNVNNFINLNCFSVPIAPASFASVCQPDAAGTPGSCMNLYGNAGRNQFTGPGLAEFDFSLFKNIPVKRISENFNIQFRAEFFNIFNRANFQSPIDNSVLFNQDGSAVGGAGALDATTTDPRQIQFGLKLVW